MNLTEISVLAKEFADARGVLSARVDDTEYELEALKRRRLPGIKLSLARAAETEAALRGAIEGVPELFEKPKTVIFYGIKVGFQKGKGKMEWEDDEALVAKIEKLFPDQKDTLINTTKTPSKLALNDLEVADLRKLGVSVEETGDRVLVKPVDGAVEKLVKTLLKHALKEATE